MTPFSLLALLTLLALLAGEETIFSPKPETPDASQYALETPNPNPSHASRVPLAFRKSWSIDLATVLRRVRV